MVGWTGQDALLGPFGTAVWSDDYDGRAEVFDEMPAGAGDGEEVCVGGYVAQDLDGGVVLEEEVHLDRYPADVFEDGGLLHVVWVGTEAVEAGSCQYYSLQRGKGVGGTYIS